MNKKKVAPEEREKEKVYVKNSNLNEHKFINLYTIKYINMSNTSKRTAERTLLLNSLNKDFSDNFKLLSSTRSSAKVFSDFLDYFIYTLSLSNYKEDIDRIKTEYSEKELSLMVQMMLSVGDSSENNDVLGDIFMEYVSFGHNGQFFTPMHIADFMALTVVGKLEEGQSVYDPACGSGRMFLAANKIARKSEKKIYYYGADLDLMCVKMCTINMFINTMPGEIAWMDTITMSHWKSFHIKVTNILGMYVPSLYVSGANETYLIERIKNTQLKEEVKDKSAKPTQLTIEF